MSNTDAPAINKAGFVAVLGLPNAGKSTLVNALVGAKVTIVSRKAQTTRAPVRGIFIEDDAQVILVDTPGLLVPDAQRKRARLETAMQSAAISSLEDGDAAMLVIDASVPRKLETLQRFIKGLDGGLPANTIAVLNKVDLIAKHKLLDLATAISQLHPFAAYYMISAETGDGIDDLRRGLARLVPESPALYDVDQLSDLPVRLMLAELTREQIFNYLHDEIPYGTHVVTDDVVTRENDVVAITQRIVVLRDTHKAMMIGRDGAMLKRIGSATRAGMEESLQTRVFLDLSVSVDARWTDNKAYYALWGFGGHGE
ncbi:MAG: GTPase Era [Pseudomonadota bacterium]